MTKTKKKLTLTESLLQDIEVAMNNSSNEMQWYLDIQKEETTFIMEYAGFDEEEEGEEGESIREMIENDVDEERFAAIPIKQSYEGWNQMERFILGLEDEKARDYCLSLSRDRVHFPVLKMSYSGSA